MKITLSLNILGYHLGALEIRLDLDEIATPAGVPARPKLMDSVSDYFASRWAARHM